VLSKTLFKETIILLFTLVMLMGLWTVANAAGPIKIRYDDGSMEKSWCSNPRYNEKYAVCFDACVPCEEFKLLAVRVYIDPKTFDPAVPIRIYVWNQRSEKDPPGQLLIKPFDVGLYQPGWNEIDLSKFDLQFPSCSHFAIGVSHPQDQTINCLGEDQDRPAAMRSWWYSDMVGGWKLWNENDDYYADWMIRAVVQVKNCPTICIRTDQRCYNFNDDMQVYLDINPVNSAGVPLNAIIKTYAIISPNLYLVDNVSHTITTAITDYLLHNYPPGTLAAFPPGVHAWLALLFSQNNELLDYCLYTWCLEIGPDSTSDKIAELEKIAEEFVESANLEELDDVKAAPPFRSQSNPKINLSTTWGSLKSN
jgi:hypothetical protein